MVLFLGLKIETTKQDCYFKTYKSVPDYLSFSEGFYATCLSELQPYLLLDHEGGRCTISNQKAKPFKGNRRQTKKKGQKSSSITFNLILEGKGREQKSCSDVSNHFCQKQCWIKLLRTQTLQFLQKQGFDIIPALLAMASTSYIKSIKGGRRDSSQKSRQKIFGNNYSFIGFAAQKQQPFCSKRGHKKEELFEKVEAVSHLCSQHKIQCTQKLSTEFYLVSSFII